MHPVSGEEVRQLAADFYSGWEIDNTVASRSFYISASWDDCPDWDSLPWELIYKFCGTEG